VIGIVYGMIVSPPFRAATLIVIGTGAMLGAILLWLAMGDPLGWKEAARESRANMGWKVISPRPIGDKFVPVDCTSEGTRLGQRELSCCPSGYAWDRQSGACRLESSLRPGP
jgi:hypothetical protein